MGSGDAGCSVMRCEGTNLVLLKEWQMSHSFFDSDCYSRPIFTSGAAGKSACVIDGLACFFEVAILMIILAKYQFRNGQEHVQKAISCTIQVIETPTTPCEGERI
jgi:hypothetical protein